MKEPAIEERLHGLSFLGLHTLAQQRAALYQHLYKPVAPPQERGWLPPLYGESLPSPKRYTAEQLVWIYEARELGNPQDLHPAVARSLVAEYMKQPGRIVDPMAGSGTLVQEARLQGHQVWAGDKFPRDSQTVEFDLFAGELLEVLEDHTPPGKSLDVGLLVLHPPVPETIGDALVRLKMQYSDWLLRVLENSWPVVADRGYLVLVVTISTTADTLSHGEWAIKHACKSAFGTDPAYPLQSRIAVSRDGKQGWHILALHKGEEL